MEGASPLAANRFAEDPLLYTTPNCRVKRGYSNTDGVNNALSANRFAAKQVQVRYVHYAASNLICPYSPLHHAGQPPHHPHVKKGALPQARCILPGRQTGSFRRQPAQVPAGIASVRVTRCHGRAPVVQSCPPPQCEEACTNTNAASPVWFLVGTTPQVPAGITRVRVVALGACREPFNFTPTAVNSISSGSPRVRCTPHGGASYVW